MDFPDIDKEEDFKTFRSKGIGSSDMPIILGVSPFKTKHKLWLEKTGIAPNNFQGNWATQRGTDLEPMVRDWYNKEFSTDMKPERKVNDESSHFRANADGVDHSAKKMIEIKCGNLADHEAGIVPEKYVPQCVYLSVLFGYPLNYVSYNEKSDTPFKVIELNYTKEYADNLIDEANKFWDSVVSKTEPALSDKDDFLVEDADIIDLVKSYEELKLEESRIKGELKSVQSLLESKTTHTRSMCNGYRLSWVERKGAVDYSKIEGVDFEKLRKKPTKYFTIRKVKSESERS